MTRDPGTIVDLRDPAWSAFVASSPAATPFHHPEWASLVADAYGFDAFAFVLRDANGDILAGVPVVQLGRRRLRWTSLAFTDYVPPLGPSASVESLIHRIDAERQSRGVRSFEIRAPVGAATNRRKIGYRHALSLDAEPDELFSRFHRSQIQRGIKRAEREGVRVRLGTSPGDLTEHFYGLHLATRRRLGVPIQPRSFFQGLWTRIIEPGLGSVLLAEVNGTIAAAAVFLGWRGRMIYKFGASDRATWPHRPNHALFWDVIQRAHAGGFHELDFGRTDFDNQGLRTFKANWGAVESELVYSTTGEPPTGRGQGVASHALSALIKRSPETVCRVIGERLYRYGA